MVLQHYRGRSNLIEYGRLLYEYIDKLSELLISRYRVYSGVGSVLQHQLVPQEPFLNWGRWTSRSWQVQSTFSNIRGYQQSKRESHREGLNTWVLASSDL